MSDVVSPADQFPLDAELLRFWRLRADYLEVLGQQHLEHGDPARAGDCFTRHLALASRLQDPERILDALTNLSDAAVAQARVDDSLWALESAAALIAQRGGAAGRAPLALTRALPTWRLSGPPARVLTVIGLLLDATRARTSTYDTVREALDLRTPMAQPPHAPHEPVTAKGTDR
jgi:hypothetical protein